MAMVTDVSREIRLGNGTTMELLSIVMDGEYLRGGEPVSRDDGQLPYYTLQLQPTEGYVPEHTEDGKILVRWSGGTAGKLPEVPDGTDLAAVEFTGVGYRHT